MNAYRFCFACSLLLTTSIVNAGQEKLLICHVGNEVGPNGETYLDDPAFDAGKIDLIVVAEKAADSHLDNPGHEWDGIPDYDPIAMGASGNGTEDTDGNGIDDGCEIPEACPCWDELELQAITAENQDGNGCNGFLAYLYPDVAWISAVFSSLGFVAFQQVGGGPACATDPYGPGDELVITEQEADSCIAQIAQRCIEIGVPIPNSN